MLDLGAYAAVDSLGWAEQEIPSVAEEVSADTPADWLLPLPPKPGGAGPSVPYSLAASVACDSASTAAAVATAGVDSQLLGTAGTGCGWPFQGQFRALLPAVASSDVLRCLRTVKAWWCDSCSLLSLRTHSSHGWLELLLGLLLGQASSLNTYLHRIHTLQGWVGVNTLLTRHGGGCSPGCP